MKTKLSVVQIILASVAFVLPFTETMFTWITYTMFENRSRTNMSLHNIMTVQLSDFCGFLFWLFVIALILVIVYFVAEIFVGEKIPENKIAFIATFIPVVIMIIMVIICANHSDVSTWEGEAFSIAVTSTIFSYIELALLVSIPVVECYKKFKIS